MQNLDIVRRLKPTNLAVSTPVVCYQGELAFFLFGR